VGEGEKDSKDGEIFGLATEQFGERARFKTDNAVSVKAIKVLTQRTAGRPISAEAQSKV
jgi:hypothetical protein